MSEKQRKTVGCVTCVAGTHSVPHECHTRLGVEQSVAGGPPRARTIDIDGAARHRGDRCERSAHNYTRTTDTAVTSHILGYGARETLVACLGWA